MKTSNFQFLKPHLEDIYFSINKDYIPDEPEVEMQNQFGINVKKSKDKNMAYVQLTLEINMDDSINKPFEMFVKVASEFKWESDMDEKVIDTMLNSNAPALLLSYMRPIVANITNVSNIPVYNLPFINFKQ